MLSRKNQAREKSLNLRKQKRAQSAAVAPTKFELLSKAIVYDLESLAARELGNQGVENVLIGLLEQPPS